MLEFKELGDLKQSPFYLNDNWVRIIRNNFTMEYTIELVDYGTPLTHQTTIEINFKKTIR